MAVNRARDGLIFILSISFCLCAGFTGSLFTEPNIRTWYAGLNKPFFTPPNRIFAPVWTTLYIMMGISLFLVLRKGLKSKESRKGLLVFVVQLLLNGAWSAVFFGAHSILGGLLLIIALWSGILYSIIIFFRISHAASFLLFPYLLWVSFASALNFALLLKN